jgi:hypothetical protein
MPAGRDVGTPMTLAARAAVCTPTTLGGRFTRAPAPTPTPTPTPAPTPTLEPPNPPPLTLMPDPLNPAPP